ncbi:MAG: hypothetical protein MUE40_07500 [Anaerolineae bacterium]|jgi:hypothetical protein|nr:hypothetical protein [Anaerolineae bacterium]
MTDLFIELFPVVPAAVPALTAFAVQWAQPAGAAVGGKLAYRLARAFPGRWLWAQERLLTDAPVLALQLEIALELLRDQFPDLYGGVVAVQEDTAWQPTPAALAEIAQRLLVREHEAALHAALAKLAVSIKQGSITREVVLHPAVVAGEAALALSIRSQVWAAVALAHLLQTEGERVFGLRVVDTAAPSMTGTLTHYRGPLAQHRERLLSLTQRPATRAHLLAAPDDAPVVTVASGENTYDYVADRLAVLVRHDSDDAARFGLVPQQVEQGLRLRPEMRAGIVRVAADVLKQAGIIASAYNSRTHPHLFATIDFVPNLVFGSRRVLPYRPATLGHDFVKGGLYRRHPRFAAAPVRVAIINTLEDLAEDFIEALRRQMERHFGLTVDMARARRVRVINDDTLKSAVRVVEKEQAHIVLLFIKDDPAAEAGVALLKSLTLGRGIATHAIYENTLHNPEAMPLVMMGLLAKTGNIPFALAEPLDYADYVIGLGLQRESTRQGDRVTALSRIYRSDGVFVRYLVETLTLERDEPVPFVLMQTLFPHELLAQQRSIVHHDGPLPALTLHLLERWQVALNGHLIPVEVLRQHTPRLYGMGGGKIGQPPWGSFFRLNDAEGYLVSSSPAPDTTAQPLHVRVHGGGLLIEQAVYSLLAWTLLHYGLATTPKLPVTLQHAEDMAAWLAKGMLPAGREGDVPFWL